ncbi:MAG: hypothetical protein L3V56_00980 [Candidatus Magnetoovum sp. WYHC-5]|nr:hypothetical protein [Candidatus Magnetoovum sp. WYHC-5]
MEKKKYSKSKAVRGTNDVNDSNGAKINNSKAPDILSDIFTLSNSKIVFLCSVLVLVISFFLYYPEALQQDYDVWFHLKYGEHYVNNFTWKIDHTVFSWTPIEKNWIYVTWIGSSLLYLTYKIGGTFTLHILQWLVFLSVFIVFYAYSKIVSDKHDITNLMLLLLVAIASNLEALYIKPEMFTFTYFAVAVFIYLYVKYKNKNIFYIYPVLFLAWVNTHGAFIFGFFFLCAVFGGELVNFFFAKKGLSKTLLVHFAISIFLSYLATLFNPYGFDYHITIFNNLITENILNSASGVLAYFSLWDHVFGSNMFRFVNGARTILVMAAIFVVVFIYCARKKREVDMAILFANAAFFMISMRIARASFFFPILCYLSLIYIIQRADVSHLKRKVATVSFAIFLYWSVLVSYQSLVFLNHREWFGSGTAYSVPIKEMEFMKENKLPTPVFNDYLIGAYIMWALYPDYKVFIDPRYAPYVDEIWPAIVNFNKNMSIDSLNQLQQKYPFKTAVIHMKTMPYIMLFANHPQWRLVYFDKIAAVFVHVSELQKLNLKQIDISTQRFNDVTDPSILVDLFQIYNAFFGPQFSMQIVEIFKQNVSSLYSGKYETATKLEQAAMRRNEELIQYFQQQKQLQEQQKSQGQQ